MAKNFAEIAFTEGVKKLQEEYGSRSSYERMEKLSVIDGLSDNESRFIQNQSSFYMASFGSNDYPYIQHRGGPKGFLKVLDSHRLGFIDFTGNKQYVTVGNISSNNKVALILVDYPNRARLKIYARAEIMALNSNPDLYEFLDLDDYKFRPERMLVLHIEAYDWNCPQHIQQRFTLAEITEITKPLLDKIEDLEKRLEN